MLVQVATMTIKVEHNEEGCIKKSMQYSIIRKTMELTDVHTKLRTKKVLYISSKNIQSGNVAQVICCGIANIPLKLKIQTENISTNTNHDSEYNYRLLSVTDGWF